MALNNYTIGQQVKLSAAYTDIASTPADPTTVTVEYIDPSGIKTTKVFGVGNEVIKDSVGNYHILIDIDESGTWRYYWSGTGTLTVADQASLVGEPTDF